MSNKRTKVQDSEDSYHRIAAKKTRFAPISESDCRKGKNSARRRNAVSDKRRPSARSNSTETSRKGFSTLGDGNDVTRHGYGPSSARKGIPLESPPSSRRRNVNSEGLLSDGPSVQWYGSEGDKHDQATLLQELSKDSSPVVDSRAVEVCRNFLSSLKQDEPSNVSSSVMQNSEEVGVGLAEGSVSLGMLQERGGTTALQCSFLGRNVQPSTADLVHPDLPVNLPQDPASFSTTTTTTSSSSSSSSSSSTPTSFSSYSCCCSSERAMCDSHHRHFPSDHFLPSMGKEAPTLHHYKIVLSPLTNFDSSITTSLIHDGQTFAFDGFSLWSTVPLEHVANCTFVRFGHQHTARLVREAALEGQPPGVEEMLLLQEYIFVELLELYDWVRAFQPVSRALFFVPRFTTVGPSHGGKAVENSLTAKDMLKCLFELRAPLPANSCREGGSTREAYSDLCVTFPGKQPKCLRVDRLTHDHTTAPSSPSLVHFCTRRPADSFVGNEEYQTKLKQYIKLLGDKIRGVGKKKDYFTLFEVKHRLRELRSQTSLKREIVMEIDCRGCLSTGLRADVMRHALVMPVLAHHIRFHLSLPILEETLKCNFRDKSLLQMSLTHPSFVLKYGTTPNHIRNSLTNCAVKRPEVNFSLTNKTARKEGLSHSVAPFHNERLEFLGDAIIEYLCSLHLFLMFPEHRDGQLASYRAALVQNKHLQQVARELKLQDYLSFSHEPEFSAEGVFNHELSNCFEALIGAIFLDSSLEECDRVLSQVLFSKDGADVFSAWTHLLPHPLQREFPSGDRFMIAESDILQKLISLENSIGLEFNHIRLLAKALTHPSVEYNSLTRGHNQRLEFLGDAVLQFVVSWYLYVSFPDHHEGQLTMLRASVVNNTSLAAVGRELGLQDYALIDKKQDVPVNIKLLADLTESLLAAVLLDKGLAFVGKFCEVCLFPRLPQTTQEEGTAMDAKTTLSRKLGLELRKQGLPWEPLHYSVVKKKGPSHNPVFTVAVSVKGLVMAHGEGQSIRSADMSAAKNALSKVSGVVKFLAKETKSSS